MTSTVNCNICSNPSTPFATATVLGEHNIQYYQCAYCGFIQTETPYWLDEAYSEVINSSDLGMVARNLGLARICRALVTVFFNSNGKFVDYGGGYGLLVRLMRNSGFDFYRYDPLCANFFAKGFDVDVEAKHSYELVTAFEVFEHLVHPLEDIERMLAFSRNILFGTKLVPPHNPKPGEWQYYGLEHGQHVSFYTKKSLSVIAENFHLHLHSCRESIHLLSEKMAFSPLLFDIVAHYKVASLISVLIPRKSLTPQDFYKVTGMYLEM